MIEHDAYGQEISDDLNSSRLLRTKGYNGLCPICSLNQVDVIEDRALINFGETAKFIYVCKMCGVVARKMDRARYVDEIEESLIRKDNRLL